MSTGKFSFDIEPEQVEKFKKWEKEQDMKVAAKQKKSYPNYGASGGAYTFSFTPTSIGVVVKACNSVSNESIDLSNYDEW